MTLTFAETYNMVAYLTKSDVSEGFNQILDFLNGSSIKYALTVNPNIYVSCIKQFWTTVAVKKVNDIIRLQALVDRKKVVVTEATIREALRMDDAEGVECLPNEEIFEELARMGYEKPFTKLTFYKAFFSSQWNLVRNVDSTSKFYLYPRFLPLMIRKQVGDLSTHTTKYTSLALSQKVFANIRRVAKEGDAEVHGEEVNAGDTAKGDVTAAYGEVPTADEEPSIPSPTPPTPPPQPSHDIPSTSQVQPTPPQSPQVQPQTPQPQPQPQQDARIPMNLLPEVMDTCTALTRRVEHLEFDKVAQALEITKLKRRVKKLERRIKVKVIKLRRLQKVGTSQRVKTSDETVMDDVSNQGRMIAEMDQDADVVLEDDKEVVDEAKEFWRMPRSTNITAVEAQVPAVPLTATPARVTAARSRRRKGVVIRDPEENSTTSTIIPTETKSKDKGKGIMVEDPKPLKKKQQIEQDEQYPRELQAELYKNIDWYEAIDHVKRKAKEDPAVKRYQVLKRKPQTKAQARKNMMVYLKNVVGLKMDYFKGMSYDDIRPIFKRYFDSNVAFLQKTKEHIKEEESRALKRINETPTEKAAKRKKLDEEKNQRSVHGLAKVKGWKLLESCGMQIITFTTTQLILLVEKKYPLTRFTLDQMLNAVRLEVEEESEVSLELLRFTRKQHQEGQLE
uniref:Xylulose kinase-1 n=1 Tax=Tanacetum cinerariifolium TaxID=118510 RepID=A0A699IH48_TANCI|nr:xylulose kinase-1 [Tanacetum cinerariifolium]